MITLVGRGALQCGHATATRPSRKWVRPVCVVRRREVDASRSGAGAAPVARASSGWPPADGSSGRENARRNQPGAIATLGQTSFDVISAGLSRIGGRPDPCREARFRSDRRRCGDRSSPRLTVPTAPSGKTYITGGPARRQRPYPRMSMSRCRFHPRSSRDCGRNVDASTRRVCYACGIAVTARPPVPRRPHSSHLAIPQSRRGLGPVDLALDAHRGSATGSLSVDVAGAPRRHNSRTAQPPPRLGWVRFWPDAASAAKPIRNSARKGLAAGACPRNRATRPSAGSGLSSRRDPNRCRGVLR